MTASALVLVPLGLYMLVLIGARPVGPSRGREPGGLLRGRQETALLGHRLQLERHRRKRLAAARPDRDGLRGRLPRALGRVRRSGWGFAIAWTLVSRPFKEYTDRYRAITVPDYLEERFRDRRQLLRKLSIAIVLSMVAVYCCAQLVATGKAFSSFLGFSYVHGVFLGAGVTIVYTAVGGFKAVAYSDLVQGLLMVGGLVMLPIAGFAAAGGWDEVVGALRAADPDLLRAMGSPRRDLGRRAFGRELRRHRPWALPGGSSAPDPVHVRGVRPRTRAGRPGRGRVHGAVRPRRRVHRDRRPCPVPVAGRPGNRDAEHERGAVSRSLHRHLPWSSCWARSCRPSIRC